jgi:hypothetical protein
MWEMITQYSQFYLEQSRFYLGKLKNYHAMRQESIAMETNNLLLNLLFKCKKSAYFLYPAATAG